MFIRVVRINVHYVGGMTVHYKNTMNIHYESEGEECSLFYTRAVLERPAFCTMMSPEPPLKDAHSQLH